VPPRHLSRPHWPPSPPDTPPLAAHGPPPVTRPLAAPPHGNAPTGRPAQLEMGVYSWRCVDSWHLAVRTYGLTPLLLSPGACVYSTRSSQYA